MARRVAERESWRWLPAFVAVAAFALGCGAPLPDLVPVVSFPTAEDLGPEIARGARHDGGREAPEPRAEVAEYTLSEGAPAFGAGNVPVDHGAVARDLAESGAARPVSTAGMACAAERLAEFVAEHGAQPPRDLLDFIVGRCGVTSVGAEVLIRREPLEAEAEAAATAAPSPEELAPGYRALYDQLRRRLEGRPVPFEVELGEAHRDTADHRVMVVVHAPRRAVLSASALPDGRFLLAGRVEGERVRALAAWVNQGAYGVEPCEPDPAAELPDLRFTCEMNRHDDAARVELVVVPRQRFRPHRVAAILLHRGDEPSLAWRPQPELPPSATTGPFVDQLAAALAVAREDAGRDPVPFSPLESARQAPLFEAWLAVEHEADRGAADRVALALLAGWRVEAPLIGAQLFVGDALATDARAFVRRTLAGPWARHLLLSDDADVFAAAAAEERAEITVFRAWQDDEVAAYRAAWARSLDAERIRHGLSPVIVLGEVRDVQQEADRVTTGELHPREALDNAMARVRGRLARTVRGWYVEAYDPRWVVLPDAFLDSGATDVVLGVAYLRPPGGAWGQFVYFVLSVAQEE